ncbi:ankyrin repeat [Fusarium beomiforme]|uniref:Ankyrin repeat n=1 Tax=Fusarium beomiforme TaxID=44412 RepID=A0A9P5A9X5_9HYPO|nr:ankyrin repeat [Fusarium beomiforme]
MFLLLLFVGCATADAGDDFSNNLFSDLAPLLALFGERVAMQFMSQSMGWADHFILAMAPVGIITIIVSAIRVGGPSWLKAIIGRARENLAVAEAELMSSMSKEVCELWNGQEVVRCMGSAPVIEFICLLPKDAESYAQMEIETVSLKEALKRGDLITFNSKGQDPEGGLPSSDPPKPKIVIVRNTTAEAPNISLNSHSQFGRGGLRVVAVIATILQFGVLAFCGFATYHPNLKFKKDDSAIQDYAFPCTATGTLTLIVGLLICSHVVESSTTEERYKPGPGRRARMVWLQKTQTVSDQHFGSYAIFAADDRELITTSHRAIKGKEAKDAINGSREGVKCAKKPSADLKAKAKEVLVKPLSHFGIKAVIGTATSLCGFIVQFIGLRGMHWSASIAQLLAVLIMMAFRALVRRGLAKPPECIKLTSGFELDWFATALGDIDKSPWMAQRAPNINSQTRKAFRKWTVRTGEIAQKHDNGSGTDPAPEPNNSGSEANYLVSALDAKHLCSAHEVMKLRRNLGRLADWRGPASEEAISVARAIEITMDTLFGTSCKDSLFSWSLCAQFGGLDNPVNFQLKRQESGKWKAYSDEIEASLSLWLYSVNELEDKDPQNPSVQPIKRDDEDDGWHRAKGSSMKRRLRLLGLRTKVLDRSLEWWMPNEAPSILQVRDDEEIVKEVERHRLVGSSVQHRIKDNPLNLGPPEADITSNTNPDPVDSEMSSAENDSTEVNKDSSKILLVAESYSPLKLLYAQDIFSAFMWTAADLLSNPMPGAAEIRPIDDASGADSWQSFKLRNNVYLSVIPPLGVQHKLPKAEAIVRLARDHSKRYEKMGLLAEAGRIYEWLFEAVTVFQPESRVCVRATTVLMEHLRQLTLTIELKALENDEGDLKDLERQKSNLEERLRDNRDNGNTAVISVVSNLVRMYKAQRRGWKCGLTQEDKFERKVESDMEDKSDEEGPDVDHMFRGLMTIPYLGLTKLHQVAVYDRRLLFNRSERDDAVNSAVSVDRRDVMDWTPLHYAAAFGGLGVYPSSHYKMDTTACDLMEWTPLHYACLRGNEYMVLNLIGQGAEVNAQGRDGKAPLHCAAMGGHLDLVKLLVEAGAEIDVADAFWTTPLLWAARNGYESIVDYLWPETSHKLRDYKGRTALHLAVAAGKIGMVKNLLNQQPKADAEARDRSGETPLHYAAQRGQEAMANLLIKAGASTEVHDNRAITPLHLAVLNRQDGIVRTLLDAGANTEAQYYRVMTPLHYAAQGRSEAIVRLLIDAGADKEAQDEEGLTPLHSAVKQELEATLALLVDAGASKEAPDKIGLIPLLSVVQNGLEAVVRLFINAGADKDARDKEGLTPLYVAVARGQHNYERWLDNTKKIRGEEWDEGNFMDECYPGLNADAAIVKLLIDAGSDKDAAAFSGSTPRQAASRSFNPYIRRLLNIAE